KQHHGPKPPRAGPPDPDSQAQRGDDPRQADGGEMLLGVPGRQEVEQHHHDRRADDDEHREQNGHRDRRRLDHSNIPPGAEARAVGNAVTRAFVSTSAISASTAARVLPVKETGYTPIQTMKTRTGTSTAHSRGVRSRSLRFSSCVTSPKITRWYIHKR